MNLNVNMNLTSDQKAFVNSTKQFADAFVANNALEWDKNKLFSCRCF